MFGFLAAFGPVGIAAAVVGTVGAAAYGAMKDDGGTYSDKSEREAEARAEARQANKTEICDEIERYKSNQTRRLKEKYKADIEFFNEGATDYASVGLPLWFASEHSVANDARKIKISSSEYAVDTISALETETKEILELIKNLERLRYE